MSDAMPGVDRSLTDRPRMSDRARHRSPRARLTCAPSTAASCPRVRRWVVTSETVSSGSRRRQADLSRWRYACADRASRDGAWCFGRRDPVSQRCRANVLAHLSRISHQTQVHEENLHMFARFHGAEPLASAARLAHVGHLPQSCPSRGVGEGGQVAARLLPPDLRSG